MPKIAHDWDADNYVALLNAGYEEYRRACYGDRDLPPVQLQETKQAFLSGILWLSARESYCPEELVDALRTILSEHIPAIKPS